MMICMSDKAQWKSSVIVTTGGWIPIARCSYVHLRNSANKEQFRPEYGAVVFFVMSAALDFVDEGFRQVECRFHGLILILPVPTVNGDRFSAMRLSHSENSRSRVSPRREPQAGAPRVSERRGYVPVRNPPPCPMAGRVRDHLGSGGRPRQPHPCRGKKHTIGDSR
jgi:hypothetical protein